MLISLMASMALRITRRKLIIVIAIVVVAVIGFMVFSSWPAIVSLTRQDTTKTTGSDATTSKGVLTTSQQKEVSVASAAATEAYNGGDVSGAIAQYDKYIAESSDDVVVAQLEFNKGLLLLNTARFAEALQLGQDLEKSTPSNNSAMLIAEANAGLGNKAQAITYYKLAIERIKLIPVDLPASQGAPPAGSSKATTTPAVSNTQLGYEKRLSELEK